MAPDSYGRVYTELVRLRLVPPLSDSPPERLGEGSSSDSGEVLVCRGRPGSRFLKNPAKDVALFTRLVENVDPPLVPPPPPPLSDPLEYSGLSNSSRTSDRDASRMTFDTMVHSFPVLGTVGSIFSLLWDLDLVGGTNTSS